MVKNSIFIVPEVQSCNADKKIRKVKTPVFLAFTDDLFSLREVFYESFNDVFTLEGDGDDLNAVKFIRAEALPAEGYEITISDEIIIKYSKTNGAFYALMSLRQLLIGKSMPCCRIADYPALPLRGFMLDVSRGKIPKMSALKSLVDVLASFKYNHLELYFEGLPFQYPSFKKYALPAAYTPADIKELNEYCAARCIELVPNLNSLGHMAPWLEIPEFRHLAELEQGLKVAGFNAPPTTLDSENPDSLNLVMKLIDELAPLFSTNVINVGLDEPFELGKGKNAEKAALVGANRLYIDYVKRMEKELTKRGNKMMIWGDTVSRELSDDCAKELSDGILLLEWGYQAEYPFDARAKRLSHLNKQFILCPGTSSWLSVGGITDNMLKNVENAAIAARKYNAKGMLLTDWGDGGHIQCREISYPAIVYFSALSWQKDTCCSEEVVAKAMNRYIFFDKSNKLGQLLLDIGRYAQFEEVTLDCRTVATLPLLFPKVRGEKCAALLDGIIGITLKLIDPSLIECYNRKMNERKKTDVKEFNSFIEKLNTRLIESRPQCEGGDLVKLNLQNTIDIIFCLTNAWHCLKSNAYNNELADKLRITAERYVSQSLIRNRPCKEDTVFTNLNALADNLTLPK